MLAYIFKIFNLAPLNWLGSKIFGPCHVSDLPTLGHTMMKNDLEMDLFIMVRHIFMIYSHVKIKNFV